MTLFSFLRSSSPKSSSSVPLNEDGEQQRSNKRGRRFLGKFRRGGRKSSRSDAAATKQTTTGTTRTRRGMDFFGFCDMRIATVLLNLFHMSASIIVELIKASRHPNHNFFADPPILLFLALGTSGLGMFGGLHFASCAILLSSMGMCFLWYLYLVEMHIFGCFMLACTLLAQTVLVVEIMLGIMTPETYAMEEYIDRDGRKALETVHGLSVDMGETAVEFAEEVAIEFKRQSSGFSQQSPQEQNTQSTASSRNEEC